MLSHISPVHTNCFVSVAIFLAPATQDDRGKYVRQNFPLRPSFTPPNPPRKSQRSRRIVASLAIERLEEEFVESCKTLRVKETISLRRNWGERFQRGFRRETNRAPSRYRTLNGDVNSIDASSQNRIIFKCIQYDVARLKQMILQAIMSLYFYFMRTIIYLIRNTCVFVCMQIIFT